MFLEHQGEALPMVDWRTLTVDELLACLIIGEARGETPLGQVAVAHVVLNRASRPCWWGSDITSVILKPFQFSCFNNQDVNRSVVASMYEARTYPYRMALTLAQLVLAGVTNDPTNGATHYHADYVHPEWADSLLQTAKIGKHIFYKEPTT